MYDGEAVKNIDYDLDVKVFPDGSYMILDENEYHYHANKMRYSDDIKKIIDNQMNKLLDMIKKQEGPFNFSCINDYIMKYFELIFDDEQKEKR